MTIAYGHSLPFISSYWIKIFKSFSRLHYVWNSFSFRFWPWARWFTTPSVAHQQMINSVIQIFFLEFIKFKNIFLSFCTFARKKGLKMTKIPMSHPKDQTFNFWQKFWIYGYIRVNKGWFMMTHRFKNRRRQNDSEGNFYNRSNCTVE